jgi:mono/diheme cytochrome c family protein
MALGVALLASGAWCYAENSGAAVYKSKCLTCHGASGMADGNVGKVMHVKPISDPEVKKMSLQGMIEATRTGMGKMQGYKGILTDSEIRESVEYFRSFLK